MSRVVDAVQELAEALSVSTFFPARRAAPTGREWEDIGSIEAPRRSRFHDSGLGFRQRNGHIVLRKVIPREMLVLTDDEWKSHPAVYEWPGSTQWNNRVVLYPWVSDAEALAAVLATDISPDYVREAWDVGVRDIETVLEAWAAGIPVEFLSAMGGAA